MKRYILLHERDRRNLISFNTSNRISPSISCTTPSRHDTYPLFFDNTQLSLSSVLNILGLTFTCNLNRKINVSVNKTSFSRVGVCIVSVIFSPLPERSLNNKGLARPYIANVSHVFGSSTFEAVLAAVEFNASTSSVILFSANILYLLN